MWPDGFWKARHDEDLVCFLTAERTEDDKCCEIGFRLRPDLTGGGRGAPFLTAVLHQLRRSQDPARIVLSVAAYNLRAIRVYEGAGFETVERYVEHTNGGVHDFVRMELQAR